MRLPRPLTLFRRDIPGCTVLSRLGSGRYGVCYLVRREDGALAVLKRFRRRDPAEHGWEAVILSQLRHPAVPELLGVCVLPRHYGFWLEYMPGKAWSACCSGTAASFQTGIWGRSILSHVSRNLD